MSEQVRPPIVTILGHVDHGKTTLLDFIRKSAVASREHGGITQHIGAYQVEHEGKLITFIDTPGHAAFEKMRSRGAGVADIAVLVVAVDDAIMPQTVEAIKHIQAAKVPMIVAVNKVDLPGINITGQMEKIKKQLSDNGILVEEYGGDTPIIPLSAKSGEGVDKLLEMILLVAEVNEISGDPDVSPVGVVIEANLDKFKGPIATLLVRNGTLRKNDQIVLGGVKGKIRGMFDFAGKVVEEVPPSTPVEILGLQSVPAVGAVLGEESSVVSRQSSVLSLVDKLRAADTNTLNVVVKADKQGSLEAIVDALHKFNEPESPSSGSEQGEHVKIISSGTGDITEADITLASATHAIVLGFNSKVVPAAVKLAEVEQVLVRTYTIIYELIDEMSDVVESMLKVGALEEVYGVAQILQEFEYGKNQKIAGCRVLDGQITKGPKIKILRGEEVIGETKIKSLKKAKEEVQRVERSDECGMMFEPAVDFEVGDVVQSFRTL